MGYKTRGSEWFVLLRCLVILRRLQRGPANRDELVRAVKDSLGEDAYPEGEPAWLAAFKHDRERLRRQLQAEWTYDPVERAYTLLDPGPFGYLELSPEHVQALKLLSQTFAGEVGELASVQGLLDELAARLPPGSRRALESGSLPMELDLYQGWTPTRRGRG
jgi:hypothetical protein